MKIVLTGGCTGGHIYPALAIGDKFREKDPDCEIIYIASGEPLERDIIPKHGYTLYEVESTYFDRSNLRKLAGTVKTTMRGRKEARSILEQFRPDAVISTGSFVSVPVVLAAKSLGIPVYIHEQNGYPGVSNKMAAGFAKNVFLGFESAREHFKNKKNIVYSGNPVRAEFAGRDRFLDREELGILQGDLVIVVFGGSLGSETTNSIGEAVARQYADKKGYTVIWGTGKDYYDDISKRLAEEGFAPQNVRISAFINNMPQVLSACDLIISRSGALSTAETTMAGRPAIFIPSPNVTADHQYYNAKAVADAGGAVIVRENDDTVRIVMNMLSNLDNNRDLLVRMSAASRAAAPVNATEIIYSTVTGEGDVPPAPGAKESGTAEKPSGDKKKEAERDLLKTGLPADHAELGEVQARITQRKLENARKKRKVRTRVYIITAALILLVTTAILSMTGFFTVDSIEVQGNSHYTADEIINIGHAVPGRNLLFDARKKEITEYLEQNPYIKSAEVKRRLPSTLVIKVSERSEKFAFRYDDDYLVMDESGILLKKSRNEPKITIVEGVVINRIKPGEKLGTENSELFDKTTELLKAADKADLYFVRLDVSDPKKINAYIYDSLTVKGDYDDIMTNIQNGRLHMVLEKLFADGIKRGTITFVDDGTASFQPTI